MILALKHRPPASSLSLDTCPASSRLATASRSNLTVCVSGTSVCRGLVLSDDLVVVVLVAIRLLVILGELVCVLDGVLLLELTGVLLLESESKVKVLTTDLGSCLLLMSLEAADSETGSSETGSSEPHKTGVSVIELSGSVSTLFSRLLLLEVDRSTMSVVPFSISVSSYSVPVSTVSFSIPVSQYSVPGVAVVSFSCVLTELCRIGDSWSLAWGESVSNCCLVIL